MSAPVVKLLILESFLAMLNKSVGTPLFQNVYAEVDGVKKDITNEGELSCALYVSSILSIFGLIDRAHTTVAGAVKAMEQAGWEKTSELEPGVVLVWERPKDGSFNNEHIGFYLEGAKAISNSATQRTPQIHHLTFGEKDEKGYREIIGMYRHPLLK
jgi:hypothetical protein